MVYNDFKSSILLNEHASHKEELVEIDGSKYYKLYTADDGDIVECTINTIDDSSDVTDYESNYKIDAVVIFRKRDAWGNQVVAPTLEDVQGLYPKKKMYKGTIVAGQLNIFDEVVSTEKHICGGEYWVYTSTGDIHEDDYVEFSIVDKDDILGLFSLYGLSTSTGDVLELSKFVLKDYAKKNKINSAEYYTQCYEGIKGTNSVYTGLYYRAYFDSNGIDNAKFMWRMYYYE